MALVSPFCLAKSTQDHPALEGLRHPGLPRGWRVPRQSVHGASRPILSVLVLVGIGRVLFEQEEREVTEELTRWTFTSKLAPISQGDALGQMAPILRSLSVSFC